MESKSNLSKYSIILPTYNERENIPIITWLLFDMADKNNLDIELIIVEDNSPDGTGAVVKELQRIYGKERIIILERPGKLGLGSAYMDGIKKCSGNFIILMDADFSHHPKFIPQFIEMQQKTKWDVVTGTRYRRGGGVYGWDLRRKLTSRVANFIASFFIKPKACIRSNRKLQTLQKISSRRYYEQSKIKGICIPNGGHSKSWENGISYWRSTNHICW